MNTSQPNDDSIALERQQQLREDLWQLSVELRDFVDHQLKLWSDPSFVDPPDPEPDDCMSIDDVITLIETAVVLGHRAAGVPLDPSLFPKRPGMRRLTVNSRSKKPHP